MKIAHKIYLLVLVLWLSACNKSDTEDITPQYLVNATVVSTKNAEAIKADFTSQFGTTAAFLQGYIKYDLQLVKISYKTTNTDGTPITASGAFYVPVLKAEATNMLPLASLQHGTITDQSLSPSNFQVRGEAIAGLILATSGYFVAMPDYIGYGDTQNLEHPYEHRKSLASSSLDFLRAVKEYIAQEKLKWNNSLYIGGYSEGGFASMSLAKEIQEAAISEFKIKAVSLGAGAYDKTAFTKYVATTHTPAVAQFNASYIWTILTYDKVYQLNRDLKTYFVDAYTAQIASKKQNVVINVSMHEILNATFAAAIASGSDMAFANAVKDNDVFDWKPSFPMRLYHGTADEYVPFFNSENAFKAMKARGATDVFLVPINGKTHSTALQDYLLGTLDMFDSYK